MSTCACVCVCACMWNKRDVCAFEMRFFKFFPILHTNACTNTSFRAVSLVKLHTIFRTKLCQLRDVTTCKFSLKRHFSALVWLTWTPPRATIDMCGHVRAESFHWCKHRIPIPSGRGKMAQCFVFITELLLVLSVFNSFYYSSTPETTSFEPIDCWDKCSGNIYLRISVCLTHTWQWALSGLPFHLCRRRCTHAVMTVCCLMTRRINQSHRARGPASSFCCCYYLLELN